MKVSMALSGAVVGGVLMLSGCGGGSGNRTEPVPELSRAAPVAAEPKEQSSQGGRRKYTGISLEIPAEWRELPNQQMVDSKYIATTSKGELEVTLTSMGGGIDSNIDRWKGQIQHGDSDAPKQESFSMAGLEGTLIDCRGRYSSNVATNNPGSKNDWRLVGIGVPAPGRDFFVRVVGPREAVAEFYEPLMNFLKTAEVVRN